METADTATTPEPAKDASADEIVADIERTRAQLGESVNALTVKLDVKAQAKNKVDDVKDHATRAMSDAKQSVLDRVQQAKDSQTVSDLRDRPTVPEIVAGSILIVGVVAAVVRGRQR